MDICHKARKVIFANIIAAAIVITCSGSASKIQEDTVIPQEIPEVKTVLPVVNEVIVEEIKVQSEKQNDINIEKLVIHETVESKRENNLYYIIDDGYRFDISEEWQDYLWDKCVEYEITDYYELIFAQIYHESGWNPEAVSGTEDYGLMQINKSNHRWLKDILDITDFLDPYESIDAGVYMMSSYLKKYNDAQKALVCYNMGESKVKRGITSSQYSKGVIKDMDNLFILEEENEK